MLSRSDMRQLALRAREIHARYMHPDPSNTTVIVRTADDALAYMALRFPATYAQISGAFMQIKERIPAWNPRTLLDVGCGPGTAILAARALFPSLEHVTGVDQVEYFISLAKELAYVAEPTLKVAWQRDTVSRWIDTPDTERYDVIVVANVMNELPGILKTRLLEKLDRLCAGMMVIVEPGTSHGVMLIERFAKSFVGKRTLVAPYIDNSFVHDEHTWIHFSQRFQRPDFLRRLRQSMRESDLMASDFEDATYSYVACGTVPDQKPLWGISIGNVEKYKGYLLVPILTRDGIIRARVLKRNKDDYNTAKEIRWGSQLDVPLKTS